MRGYIIAFVAPLLLLIAAAAPAQEPEARPVNITSDEVTYNQGEGLVTFSGNVVATHPDLTVRSQRLEVHLSGEGEGEAAMKASNVVRIVAEGEVALDAEGRDGECGRLVYHVPEKLVVMEQGPILRDGQNTISGERIEIYLAENRSVVKGGKSRVEATFFTTEEIGTE